MNYKIVDMNKYVRKEHFEHYLMNVPCTYSMTIKIDITNLMLKQYKLYPMMLYCIGKAIKNHSEFRMDFNQEGKLIIYDTMNPCYTIFHKENNTFSNIWSSYNDDFNIFNNEYEKDLKEYGNILKFISKNNTPNNCYNVSMIPWTTFEGFNLNLNKGYDYLKPIFTLGKYYQDNKRTLLPLAIQVHHAVCDGFHVCSFINDLQNIINNF